jgi:ABC-type uncharacterized transport system permease subunit
VNTMHEINKPLFLREYGFTDPKTGFIGNSFSDSGYTWQQILSIQIEYCEENQIAGWSWHEYLGLMVNGMVMLMAEMEEQISQKQKATGYLTLSYRTHLALTP